MSAGSQQGLVGAIRFDVQLMHETWMEVFYPRQRGADDTVLGKWKPQEPLKLWLYRLWGALGVPVVGVIYPLVLLGYFVRFQTRRINVTAIRLGFSGVVGLFIVLWGGLAALLYFQFSHVFTDVELIAIGAASTVAVISSALAYGFWRLGGRVTTVVFAYPFAMTAIFLPPVVAALFSAPLAEVVLTRSDALARWLFFAGPEVITDPLGEQFDRQEAHHVIIWFAISVPVGWVLGTLVTIADLIRPRPE